MSCGGLGSPTVTRHFLLDLARFIAAAAVVVWHYQHFFYSAPGVLSADYRLESSPFYQPLKLAYHYGDLGVEFFFVLSGFVFFWLYSKSIAEQNVSMYSFAVKRFSRLYPLHFLTLIIVASLQAFSMLSLDTYIVYPENDLKHFVLHLFLILQWGFADGLSLNMPVWSVSVEVLLYIVFFILMRWSLSPLVAIALGWAFGTAVVLVFGDPIIGWAAMGFFCGGITAVMYGALTDGSMSQVWRRLLLFVLPVIMAALAWFMLRLPAKVGNELILHAALFPALVLWISLVQASMPSLGRRSAWLGNISYGIYLIHFPIQLAIILMDRALNLGLDYNSNLMFIVFVGTTISLALPLFIHFERPARDWLRHSLMAQSRVVS